MCGTVGASRGDTEDRPDSGRDCWPLLSRSERLDQSDPRSSVSAPGDLPQAVLGVVGAQLVLVQIEQPTTTGLPVEYGRSRGAGEPQSPGRNRTGQPAGEPDLGVFSGGDWRSAHRWLATADGPAVDPHEGPGRGPAAGAVRCVD